MPLTTPFLHSAVLVRRSLFCLLRDVSMRVDYPPWCLIHGSNRLPLLSVLLDLLCSDHPCERLPLLSKVPPGLCTNPPTGHGKDNTHR